MWKKNRWWLTLAVALPLGCSPQAANQLVQEAVKQAALQIDEQQLGELVQLAAQSSALAGAGVSRVQVGGGGAKQPTGGGGPAPAPLSFRPVAADDCVDAVATGMTLVEDYSGCPDRSGTIRYRLDPRETGEFKMTITFIDYSEGSPGERGYRLLDGETVWTVLPSPSGFSIVSKEQMRVLFTRNVSGRIVNVALQNNNLWVYTIDFDRQLLTINTTATFTDINADATVVLDFQEVTFDPNNCPAGPANGSASLNGFGQWVTVEVQDCAEVQLTDSRGQSRSLQISEIRDLFGPAVEDFAAFIDAIQGSQAVQVVRAESALPEDCIADPSQVDPAVAPLVGTWCTGWPADYDPNTGAPIWGGPGWLDCTRICVARGVGFYASFGGVADRVDGPSQRYMDLPYSDPQNGYVVDWIAQNVVPRCIDPYPYESGNWVATPTTEPPIAPMGNVWGTFWIEIAPAVGAADSGDPTGAAPAPSTGYVEVIEYAPDDVSLELWSTDGVNFWFEGAPRLMSDVAGLRTCTDEDWQSVAPATAPSQR